MCVEVPVRREFIQGGNGSDIAGLAVVLLRMLVAPVGRQPVCFTDRSLSLSSKLFSDDGLQPRSAASRAARAFAYGTVKAPVVRIGVTNP